MRALGALEDKMEQNRGVSVRAASVASLEFRLLSKSWAANGRQGVIADLGGPSGDRGTTDSDLPYIGLDDMPRGSAVLSDWTVEGAPAGQSSGFVRGDILFGKLRPYFKKVGVAPVDGRCSTEILVLRPESGPSWGPLLGYVLSDEFIAHCIANSTGTKMPRSEWKNVKDFPVTVPSDDEAARCTRSMRAVFDLASSLTHQSRTLVAVRDALLPKLVSGQIRVRESYDPDDVLGTVVEQAAAR